MPSISDMTSFLKACQVQIPVPQANISYVDLYHACLDTQLLEFPNLENVRRFLAHPSPPLRLQLFDAEQLVQWCSYNSSCTDYLESSAFEVEDDEVETRRRKKLMPAGRAMAMGLVGVYDDLVERAKAKGLTEPKKLFELAGFLANSVKLFSVSTFGELLKSKENKHFFVTIQLKLKRAAQFSPQLKPVTNTDNFENCEVEALSKLIHAELTNYLCVNKEGKLKREEKDFIESVVEVMNWVCNPENLNGVTQARKDWVDLEQHEIFVRMKSERIVVREAVIILEPLEAPLPGVSAEAIDMHALAWLQHYGLHNHYQKVYKPSDSIKQIGYVSIHTELLRYFKLSTDCPEPERFFDFWFSLTQLEKWKDIVVMESLGASDEQSKKMQYLNCQLAVTYLKNNGFAREFGSISVLSEKFNQVTKAQIANTLQSILLGVFENQDTVDYVENLMNWIKSPANKEQVDCAYKAHDRFVNSKEQSDDEAYAWLRHFHMDEAVYGEPERAEVLHLLPLNSSRDDEDLAIDGLVFIDKRVGCYNDLK